MDYITLSVSSRTSWLQTDPNISDSASTFFFSSTCMIVQPVNLQIFVFNTGESSTQGICNLSLINERCQANEKEMQIFALQVVLQRSLQAFLKLK